MLLYVHKAGARMRISKRKQPQKYLKATDKNTRDKLDKAIDGILEWKGDIVKIKGMDFYRLKIDHYRIGFKIDVQNKVISIEIILPRGEFYKNVRRD
jgi:mRNA-degrading endonuclease RelE of RelBE toxin-antitoxin system